MTCKLTITLVRRDADADNLIIAVNALSFEGDFTSFRTNAGLIRDDDGIVAVWEVEGNE